MLTGVNNCNIHSITVSMPVGLADRWRSSEIHFPEGRGAPGSPHLRGRGELGLEGSPGARHENKVNSGEGWSSLGLVGRRNVVVVGGE